jgi:hypothetical protein
MIDDFFIKIQKFFLTFSSIDEKVRVGKFNESYLKCSL